MEDERACSISLDVHQDEEPKGELIAKTDPGHVTARQKCDIESDEAEGFLFNRKADSLRLQSVYRYAKKIKYFLGWNDLREDSEPEGSSEDSTSEKYPRKKSDASNSDPEDEILCPTLESQRNCEDSTSEKHPRKKSDVSGSEPEELSSTLESEENSQRIKEIDERSNGNSFDSGIEHNQRSSSYLEVEDFTNHTPHGDSGVLPGSYSTGESDYVSEEDLENSFQPSVFRSEVKLLVEDCRNNKEPYPSIGDKNSGRRVLNPRTSTEMDESLVQENAKENSDIYVNDAYSIFNDEVETISFADEEVSNPEEHVKQHISECGNKNNSEGLCNKNSDKNGNSYDIFENLGDMNENDLSQKENGYEVLRGSMTLKNGNCLLDNATEENRKNNTTNLKTDDRLNADKQYEKQKRIDSIEVLCAEKQSFNVLYDKDTICGLGCFKPSWLQSCATTKNYVILYSILGILHGSYYAYLIGSLSTLEKRFTFKSKISGAIMVVDELTPLLLGMIIGYYAGKAHRPRMVALGMLLSAGSCFCSALPYFIYGPVHHLSVQNVQNDAGTEYCHPDIGNESCDSSDRPPTLSAVLLLMIGSFLKGFGNLAYYAIGLAYLDDNSEKTNTPLYLAISLALRLFGPLVGFLMSSGFLKLYENPVEDPGFGPDDPRWIGAWWIGFFLQGILLLIFTLPIALFPRRLPSQKPIEKPTSAADEEGFKNIFLGLVSALKRLGKNPVFIVLIINTTMKIFGHFGHAIMLPKYMENQFRLSASEASLFSGATTIACIMLSTVIGGFLIWKFRPRTKVLLAGLIVSEIILCCGFLVLMIPRCEKAEMLHFGISDEGLILNNVCNQNCDCSTTSFTPFCGPDGKTTYFSPCYAGCTQELTSSISSAKVKEYGNCSCVTDDGQQEMGAIISEGFCPDENCWSQALAYLIILFFLLATSNLFTVTHTMIVLRSVHPNDKSVALGTLETFICLFGFIPFPVVFGALVDSACLVWEKSCGETGNCWFYDMEKYRYVLHGVAALFCGLSVVCLITLYFLSSRIRNLYEDDEEEEKENVVNIKLDTVSGSVTKL